MPERRTLDRQIFALALPALGALASEPLYVLVDTAIVGHLGTVQLAALAIAATVLSTAFTIFNFLTYGTTAQVARLHGAGMGLAFVAVQRRAGLEPPHPSRMRALMRVGSEIAVRTTALLGSFLVASGVLARVGAASLAAHQIAFQLFVFLALVLDALAIAAQVLVGRALGAGDTGAARAVGLRVIGWSVVVGAGFAAVLAVLAGVIPDLFTDDARVQERAAEIWWIFVAMMPLNGAVFALDGILIGASDTRFLMWGMLSAAAVYVPVALLALHEGWGIVGVWWGLAALIVVRLVTCAGRFVSGRWALTGAPA